MILFSKKCFYMNKKSDTLVFVEPPWVEYKMELKITASRKQWISPKTGKEAADFARGDPDNGLVCLFIYLNFIEVELICNIVLISAVQQWISYTYICKYIFILFSTMIFYRMLNIVSWAIQKDLVVHPSYVH